MQNKAYKRDYAKREVETQEIRADATKWLKAHVFIEQLRKYSRILTTQEFRTLRDRAREGDLDGAWQELHKILTIKAR